MSASRSLLVLKVRISIEVTSGRECCKTDKYFAETDIFTELTADLSAGRLSWFIQSTPPRTYQHSVTFGSDRIRTYRGKTKDRVRRTAINCPHQNACRRNEFKNRGDARRPEPSRRIRAFRRTSDRDEGEVSNISSEVLEYKYTKYIY